MSHPETIRPLTPEQSLFVQKNLGLAHKYAKMHEFMWKPLSFEEIVGAARYGLVRAAPLYNPNLGAFSTYAWRWMHEMVKRERESLVVLSGTRMDRDYVIKGSPTVRTPEDREHRRAARRSPVSIDAKVRGTEATHIRDLIPGNDPSSEEILEISRRQRLVGRVLSRLDPRSRQIVSRRMGGETLAAIGEDLGLCRERVRQIEEIAMATLRRSRDLMSLKEAV